MTLSLLSSSFRERVGGSVKNSIVQNTEHFTDHHRYFIKNNKLQIRTVFVVDDCLPTNFYGTRVRCAHQEVLARFQSSSDATDRVGLPSTPSSL
ncbi:hypothetical protein B9Z55_017647 [Caenorhabditis nigoni]|uniref:Uncharacterized protein n=1 Tax=Caenorhabditis nigoni TaxID=1611254 RepID=A0A2G5TB02_9PELO|nr:hypothetical protein B9Z55_017647 [Caenorhabditis nigoni]